MKNKIIETLSTVVERTLFEEDVGIVPNERSLEIKAAILNILLHCVNQGINENVELIYNKVNGI